MLEKNDSERLLAGFWSFPLLETQIVAQQLSLFETDSKETPTISQKTVFEKDYHLQPVWSDKTFPLVKHTFSHRRWLMDIIAGTVLDDTLADDKTLAWVKKEDLDNYPLATPQKKLMASYFKANPL